jgi:hypothetical protein
VAVVIGAVLAATLLVAWGSSVGPGGVLNGDGPSWHRVGPSESPTAQSTASADRRPRHQQEPGSDGEHPLLRALVAVLGAAVALALLLGLTRLGRVTLERRRRRRRGPPQAVEIPFDVIETPRRMAEHVARDAAHQRELLLGGTPRNGIVACWHRFEEQAAAAGIVRDEWETSAEFTLRVLDLVDADSGQVARLAALYREARFSDHPIEEPARAAALAALDAIHASLPVPAEAHS